MPRNLTPEDRWETDFQVPIPGEPRNIGPLEILFQRLLNRTERLKNRLGAILGLPWDATLPDTLTGLAGRVSTLETNQGSTTLSAHRNAATLDHPDGSVTAEKLANGAVTTPKIANQAVTAEKLAPGSVVGHLGYTPLNKAGDTMSGTLFLPQVITNAGANGLGVRHIELRTSSVRWAMGLGGDEGSGNVGADFYLWRYDDEGNYLGEIFKAERNSGRIVFNEISGRYDHQNRFMVQSFLTDYFNFPANYVHCIAVIPVSIPSGKAIYLRRVRWALSAFLRPRVRATNQNTWTGSTNFGDASMNVLLGNSNTTFVSLEIVNNTSDGVTFLIGDGIWAEFEIR